MERQFQSLATLEGEQDGWDSRSGFVAAADLAAIAAVRLHTHQSAPTLQPGDLGGEPDLWGTVGLVASHDHFRYSEGTVQQDIQDPESRGRTDICSIVKYVYFLLGERAILFWGKKATYFFFFSSYLILGQLTVMLHHCELTP